MLSKILLVHVCIQIVAVHEQPRVSRGLLSVAQALSLWNADREDEGRDLGQVYMTNFMLCSRTAYTPHLAAILLRLDMRLNVSCARH